MCKCWRMLKSEVALSSANCNNMQLHRSCHNPQSIECPILRFSRHNPTALHVSFPRFCHCKALRYMEESAAHESLTPALSLS